MTDLTRCKEFVRGLAKNGADWANQIEKLEKVRSLADSLIAHIGAYGEVDIHHPKVDALLDALYDTDPEPEDNKK